MTIAGVMLAAGRDDRSFGLVRSQDEQPGRRFRAVLQSQGLPVTQPVTILTDGGDSVRRHCQLELKRPSALTHSEGSGSRASLSKMSFGVLVQTKGLASPL